MAHFQLAMQQVRLSDHCSLCPLCGDDSVQEGWLMGVPGLNASRITTMAGAGGSLLEARLPCCPGCDFG